MPIISILAQGCLVIAESADVFYPPLDLEFQQDASKQYLVDD